MDSAVDVVQVLSLGSSMLFPASLIPDKEIIVSIRQSVRGSLWPALEGDVIMFEDFFSGPGCGTRPPLIGCTWVPEHPAILRPVNPWNWLLAMPIKSGQPNSTAFSRGERGSGSVLFPAMQYNQQLAGSQNVAIGESFDAHRFPLKGNREGIRGFLRGNQRP